jgi:micrococcal nuclease
MKIFQIIFLIIFLGNAHADPIPVKVVEYRQYPAKVVRIIDGDTIVADIDLGFDITMTKSVRLYGIDAPEIRGEGKELGLKSKAFLEALVSPDDKIYIWVPYKETDSFGRVLGVIFDKDYKNINVAMIKGGHAEEIK